ncbi:MAG: quinolinate synthase NadA [Paludibacteraceae bacterium]|nr:quinolinate synthase NadA [Paludibacteraceae bacterium]
MDLKKKEYIDKIKSLAREKNAVIFAHYYTRPEIQEIADFIGDSLALAQQAARVDADILVMCGVHFMGETMKILCPNKKVLIPDMNAGCSLADSCKAEDLKQFIINNSYPTGGTITSQCTDSKPIVVSYVNTTAEVKALTDVVVTSSNAKKIVDQLPKDAKIIFGPDHNLGSYINTVTGRNMILWNGACHVHSRFSLEALLKLKAENPGVEVLAHPECKAPILAQSDIIGSTQALLQHTIKSPAKRFIIATESGILFEMQRACPDKEFIPVPPEVTEGVGCSCNECEYMRMNTLEKVYACLLHEQPEMIVDKEVAEKAVSSIQRMLSMS